jgi:hypothetical protein
MFRLCFVKNKGEGMGLFFKLMVLGFIISASDFNSKVYANVESGTCTEMVPYCELPYEERSLLPESLLHDPVPFELMKPQTDIFLLTPMGIENGIRQKYSYVDPKREIAERPLELALSYYDNLKGELKKPGYLGVINYKQHSHDPRFYIIDMNSGEVEKMQVTHGEGSDKKNTGYATVFSNSVNSHMSSLGAFITAETYTGKSGYSLRVDGIEKSNSKMRERSVVIHGSDYVKPKMNPIGRSWGCPAVERKNSVALIDRIKKGVLVLAWYDQ